MPLTPADEPTTTERHSHCAHCGLPTSEWQPDRREQAGSEEASQLIFCCKGCRFVYEMIHSSGLDSFYSLRDRAGEFLPTPADPGQQQYTYLDSETFAATYFEESDQPGCMELALTIHGLHCTACIWLLENTCSLLDGLVSVRVDFPRARIKVVFQPLGTSPSEIARLFDSLGYSITPLQSRSEIEQYDQHGRDLLMRLGVAGFSAGNTMLLAISLYQGMFTGIETLYQSYLQLASLFLSLPAVVYSAAPFYRTAIGSLKLRRVHIDLPISLAISAGFFISCINHLRGSSHVYFDSISMLIFLLLLGRWLQHKTLRHAFHTLCNLPTLLPIAAHIETEQGDREVLLEDVKEEDIVLIAPDSIVPVDGTILEGSSHLNLAVITGEARPIRCAEGDTVIAGARNLSSNIKVKVTASGEASRIGKVLGLVKSAGEKKTAVTRLTNRLSSYFVIAVLSCATGNFLYWLPVGLTEAVDTTLALLIVSCPCALGLAAPLAYALSTARAAHAGILVKSHRALEALADTRNILLDKTGTITSGFPTVRYVYVTPTATETTPPSLPDDLLRAVESLEQQSDHPFATALREYCRKELDTRGAGIAPLFTTEELSGLGVSAVDSEGFSWLLGSGRLMISRKIELTDGFKSFSERCATQGLSPIFLSRNQSIVTAFGIGDSVRSGMKQFITSLKKQEYTLSILSGDAHGAVQQVAHTLGIPNQNTYAECSPEQKLNIVEEVTASAPTIMIGDGVNDAAALAAATVGIGVRGGAEACLQSADIFITTVDGSVLQELFAGAKHLQRTIKRGLVISLVYNITGAALAMSGIVTPIFAALLMPLSSASVILNSLSSPEFKRKA